MSRLAKVLIRMNRLFVNALVFSSLLASRLAAQTPPPEHLEFFEKRIRPIFVARCQGCHNAKSGTAGLNLTSAAGFKRGADTGPIVVADQPEKSRLLEVVGYQERIKMPPTGKLTDDEIAALRDWVKVGAPWPAGDN